MENNENNAMNASFTQLHKNWLDAGYHKGNATIRKYWPNLADSITVDYDNPSGFKIDFRASMYFNSLGRFNDLDRGGPREWLEHQREDVAVEHLLMTAIENNMFEQAQLLVRMLQIKFLPALVHAHTHMDRNPKIMTWKGVAHKDLFLIPIDGIPEGVVMMNPQDWEEFKHRHGDEQ